jgi:hypothetical protein
VKPSGFGSDGPAVAPRRAGARSNPRKNR